MKVGQRFVVKADSPYIKWFPLDKISTIVEIEECSPPCPDCFCQYTITDNNNYLVCNRDIILLEE